MHPTDIVEAATERLFSYGVIGVFVVIFGAVIYLLWREAKKERKEFQGQIDEERKEFDKQIDRERREFAAEREKLQLQIQSLNEARVAEAAKHADQAQKLVQQAALAFSNTTAFLDSNRDATDEMRVALKDLGTELRSLVLDVRERLPRR